MARPRQELPVLAFCVYGPTGSGKTQLALQLGAEFPVEIISVDSAMVYRRLDIGTAKPSMAEQAAVRHHLVSQVEPWQPYSAGDFVRDARRLIEDIHMRGACPLLVGGTMLYFRAIFRGLAPLPRADASVRGLIDEQAAARGWPAMHEELRRVDPASATRIRPTDRQRIQRALEVYRLTGRPITEIQRATATDGQVRYMRIALVPRDRRELERRLEERLRRMLRSGLVEEVRQLMALSLMSPGVPAMRAVGYRQIWQQLAGEITPAEARRRITVATRRLAKRQLTWIRSEGADVEFDAFGADTPRRVAAVLEAAGVSRCGQRCNIMASPDWREHGV